MEEGFNIPIQKNPKAHPAYRARGSGALSWGKEAGVVR